MIYSDDLSKARIVEIPESVAPKDEKTGLLAIDSSRLTSRAPTRYRLAIITQTTASPKARNTMYGETRKPAITMPTSSRMQRAPNERSLASLESTYGGNVSTMPFRDEIKQQTHNIEVGRKSVDDTSKWHGIMPSQRCSNYSIKHSGKQRSRSFNTAHKYVEERERGEKSAADRDGDVSSQPEPQIIIFIRCG